MSKVRARREARAAIDALCAEERAAASAEICARIAALPQWAAARAVGLYAAQPGEPEVWALMDAPGKRFCFPRVGGDAMTFHESTREGLQPGAFGLLEPGADAAPIDPQALDLLLVPGLAFTADGKRLGRGGGYYDRFLHAIHPRAFKLGICFHAQLTETLPYEIHDREVDAVMTES